MISIMLLVTFGNSINAYTPHLDPRPLGEQGLGLTLFVFLTSTGGEGNGTPLQYSCLENPMDGGAW